MVTGRKDDWARWQWGKMVKGKVGRGRDGKGRHGKKNWAKWEWAKWDWANWEDTELKASTHYHTPLNISLGKKAFENILETGENAVNQHFLLFPNCFLLFH